jgi:hypothetical protein
MTQTQERPQVTAPLQRRSRRLLLRVAVEVQRKAANGELFVERSATLAVNAHGALIVLKPPVTDGDQFAVKNIKTGEEQISRVVYIGQAEPEGVQVGVEFLNPSPQMWGIVFPPEDWITSGRAGQQARRIEGVNTGTKNTQSKLS